MLKEKKCEVEEKEHKEEIMNLIKDVKEELHFIEELEYYLDKYTDNEKKLVKYDNTVYNYFAKKLGDFL